MTDVIYVGDLCSVPLGSGHLGEREGKKERKKRSVEGMARHHPIQVFIILEDHKLFNTGTEGEIFLCV